MARISDAASGGPLEQVPDNVQAAARVEPVRWPDPPWVGIGLHLTWGFHTGQFTVPELVAKAAAHGVEWLALEGYPAMDNEPFHGPLRDECHNAGLQYLLWERTDQVDYQHVRDMVERYQPDAYLADVEVDWERPENEIIPRSLAADYPDLPRAVLIAGMPSELYCRPWVAAGFDCMTQAYSGPMKHDPAEGIAGGMDRDAYWRGWPVNACGGDLHTWPVLETNAEGSAPLADQLPAVEQWHGNFSVYCAEICTDADWEALASL